MSVVVIDSTTERKEAIEKALKRAGWLVASSSINDQNLQQILGKCSIAIIMHEDELNDHDATALLSQLYVIGPASCQNSVACREYLTVNMQGFVNIEELIVEISAKVSDIHYRHIFPITVNERMKAVLNTARKAASSTVPVMILGETGSGKEVIARFVHHHSKQAKGPFIAMNCAAVPESMIEAALFGYEKGAFTNAISNHVGKFERAHNGTLFLDELGEMSLDMQAKLLRVLQTNEFERIGGKELLKVNVRIIAATNNDLSSKIAEGLFRTDLYYRLNVISIHCLSLRERVDDIQPIADYFTELYSQDLDKHCILTQEAVNKLKAYQWPGNIRELQNVLHRAVILNDSGCLNADDIRLDSLLNSTAQETIAQPILKATEADAIVKVLKEANGCRSIAAKLLKISPRTLRYKISRLREIGFDVP